MADACHNRKLMVRAKTAKGLHSESVNFDWEGKGDRGVSRVEIADRRCCLCEFR